MDSLKELYKIGPGPSSSHTLGPQRACRMYCEEFGSLLHHVEVELYGSLSLTGKGHLTDVIIRKTFEPATTTILFMKDWKEEFPNGFYIRGYDSEQRPLGKWTVFSVGGGSIRILEKHLETGEKIYAENSMQEIREVCEREKISLADYALRAENGLEVYLSDILSAMLNSVREGLNASGLLPGRLRMERAAKAMLLQAGTIEDPAEQTKMKLAAYAYAASEQNASAGTVVTAPTLGSCGVMAALMYYYYNDVGMTRGRLVRALAVAGLFGDLIKTNATISGAVGGCQAEIGAACAMAAAASAYLNDLNLGQIEYAAEIGMEHHLGLTCDPVGGYVIIPCIERNAAAVLRALDAMSLAKYMSRIKKNRVSFDVVVRTMNYTGKHLPIELKETSLGGLAREVQIIPEETSPDEKQRIEPHLIVEEAVMDNDVLASPIRFDL